MNPPPPTEKSSDWIESLRNIAVGLIEISEHHVECLDRVQVAEPFVQLLVHHEHMTRTLEAYHRGPVQLDVLRHEHHGDDYRRMILLRRADNGAVVEFGIVRIHLQYVKPMVREDIVARKQPLGSILIRHNVLRRIEPRWFLRFSRDAAVAAYFAETGSELYGRLGIIHYDGHPAIELLEVVCA